MRKKALFIVNKHPFDLHDGRNIRLFNFAKILNQKFDLDLLCQSEIAEGIDTHFFKRVIVFHIRHRKIKSIFNVILGRSSVFSYKDSRVHEFVTNEIQRYDLVYCNYIHTAVNLLTIRYKYLYIDLVDAISLHMKESRDIPFLKRMFYYLDYKGTLRLEEQVLRHFRRCFITSNIEKDHFLKTGVIDEVNAGKIIPVRNGVDCPDRPVRLREKIQNPVFGFVGRLDYYPSEIAVELLATVIMPEIRKVFEDANIHIIGKNPSRKVQKLDGQNGVKVLGFQDDLYEAFSQIDVILLPMTIASGIQNKLITAMGYGMPVITTNRALSDNLIVNGVNCLSSSISEMAEKCISLVQNDQLRFELAESGRQTIQSNFNWSSVSREVYFHLNS